MKEKNLQVQLIKKKKKNLQVQLIKKKKKKFIYNKIIIPMIQEKIHIEIVLIHNIIIVKKMIVLMISFD